MSGHQSVCLLEQYDKRVNSEIACSKHAEIRLQKTLVNKAFFKFLFCHTKVLLEFLYDSFGFWTLNILARLRSTEYEGALRFHQRKKKIILICVSKIKKRLKGLKRHDGRSATRWFTPQD